MKKLILIFLALGLVFSAGQASAEERSYIKVPRSNQLMKLEREINQRLDETADVSVDFGIDVYEATISEGMGLGQILADLTNNECWGVCETLKPISTQTKLPKYPIYEEPELLGEDFLEKVLAATAPYDKNSTRSFTVVERHDGGNYHSQILYVVTEDRSGEQYEIVKIEFIQGK